MIVVEWAEHLKPMNNSREHWTARSERVKKQRHDMRVRLLANDVFHNLYPVPEEHRVVVTFLRVSPRKLDAGDNYNSCFKSIRDEIAAYLTDMLRRQKPDHPGVNDGDENAIRFHYAPASKGAPHQHGVRVLFDIEPWKPVFQGRIEMKNVASGPKEWAKKGLLRSAVIRFDR